MVLPLVVVLTSPLQQVPPATAAALPPVAIWLADSVLTPGARGRALVRLRDAGELLVLRADGDGNISVIFPASPGGSAGVPGRATFEIPGPDGRATFAVREAGGQGTLLAARSSAPFRFGALTSGDRWDYAGALLFRPTASDPVAALLDIVDRMSEGRPYDYDVAGYSVAAGAVVAAVEASDRFASAPGPRVMPPSGYAAPAAPAPPLTVNADCTGSLISQGSACASVTYTYNAAPGGAPAPYETYTQPYAPYYNPYPYYDYYDPYLLFHRRAVRETVTVAPREQALAITLRRRQPVIPPRREPLPVRIATPRTPAGQPAVPAAAAHPSGEPGRTGTARTVPVRLVWPGTMSGGRAAPAPAAAPAPPTAPRNSSGGAIALPRVSPRTPVRRP